MINNGARDMLKSSVSHPVAKLKAFVWLNQKPDNTCGLGC